MHKISNDVPYQNRLLTALLACDADTSSLALQRVELASPTNLLPSGEAVRSVYFPESALVSLVATMRDGASAEIGAVGYEGVVGLPALLADAPVPCDAIVQIDGTAVRADAAALRRLATRHAGLRGELERFALAFLNQASYLAACNGLHSVDQRLARILLTVADRARTSNIPLTQERLASLLGARRAGVNVASRRLCDLGAIGVTRGHVTILDPSLLQRAACECSRHLGTDFGTRGVH